MTAALSERHVTAWFTRRITGRDGAFNGVVVLPIVDVEQETIRDAARLKVSGELLKPVSSKQLGARIEAIVNQRQAASAP